MPGAAYISICRSPFLKRYSIALKVFSSGFLKASAKHERYAQVVMGRLFVGNLNSQQCPCHNKTSPISAAARGGRLLPRETVKNDKNVNSSRLHFFRCQIEC